MSTRPACRIAVPDQISTGQAGPEVNRDLETLFGLVRGLARCVGKIANYLNEGNGGFDDGGGGGDSGSGGGGGGNGGGNGGGGGGGTDNDGGPWPTPLNALYDTSSNTSIPAMAGGSYRFNPGGNITVTLPSPYGCAPVAIVHGGSSNTITLKDDLGNTLCSLSAGQFAAVEPRQSGTSWVWPTAVVKYSLTGQIVAPSIYVNDDNPGLYLTSPDGTAWRINVSNLGVVSTTSVVGPES